MTVSPTTRLALLLDGVACVLGGLAVLIPAVWDITSLPEGWRVAVGIALIMFGFAVLIGWKLPSRFTLLAAILGNVAWIIAGAFALLHTESNMGTSLVLAVMVADGIMAALQAKPLLQGGHL